MTFLPYELEEFLRRWTGAEAMQVETGWLKKHLIEQEKEKEADDDEDLDVREVRTEIRLITRLKLLVSIE